MIVLKEMELHDSFQKNKMELHVEAEFLSNPIRQSTCTLEKYEIKY